MVHQQLRAFVPDRPTLNADEVLSRTANSAGAAIRRAERQSNLHWKLVHLSRNLAWQGEAVVVDWDERRAMIIVPSWH